MSRRERHDWFWHVGNDFTQLTVELTPRQVPVSARRFWQPRVDVLEDEVAFVLKAELAGVRIEDIHLSYDAIEHRIMIRGVRQEEELAHQGRVGIHQLEVFYGEFDREIDLPARARILPDQIKAQYRNGFLIIVVPKA